MKKGEPRHSKAAPYGSVAVLVREALAAGATTPKQIIAMKPTVTREQARRACLDMAASGVVERDDDGHFHATDYIRTEAEFKRRQRDVRSGSARCRDHKEPVVDVARLAAVDAALRAWTTIWTPPAESAQ